MGVMQRTDRGTWKYKFRHNKITYEESGFPTQRAAKEAERKKRNELETQVDQPIHIISFLELATAYLDHCTASFQPNTIRYKKQYYGIFLKSVTGQDEEVSPRPKKGRKTSETPKLPPEIQVDISVPADYIPPSTYANFLDTIAIVQGRKLSNRYLKNLKALYNWGMKAGLVKENPLRYIDPKGEDMFRRYVPPTEDILAVIMAAGQEEMDLILTVVGTGARISEVCRLKWDDINLEKGSITLWTRKRKGGGMQPDTISMTAKLKEVMHRRWKSRNKHGQFVFCRPNGTPYKKDSYFVRNLMSRLCKKASVKSFGFHAIRHMVATTLMDSGKATLSNIQHFLRHNRPTTTENYLKSFRPGSQEMADILDSSFNFDQADSLQDEVNDQ